MIRLLYEFENKYPNAEIYKIKSTRNHKARIYLRIPIKGSLIRHEELLKAGWRFVGFGHIQLIRGYTQELQVWHNTPDQLMMKRYYIKDI